MSKPILMTFHLHTMTDPICRQRREYVWQIMIGGMAKTFRIRNLQRMWLWLSGTMSGHREGVVTVVRWQCFVYNFEQEDDFYGGASAMNATRDYIRSILLACVCKRRLLNFSSPNPNKLSTRKRRKKLYLLHQLHVVLPSVLLCKEKNLRRIKNRIIVLIGCCRRPKPFRVMPKIWETFYGIHPLSA